MTKDLCKRNKTADILDIKSDAGYVFAIFATFDSVNVVGLEWVLGSDPGVRVFAPQYPTRKG